MAFADTSTYFECGDGSILGRFDEKDTGKLFEFSKNPASGQFSWPNTFDDEFPHLVWVSDKSPSDGWNGWACRYAKVLKTVAYVVTDEAEDGSPVVEKWYIKPGSHKLYTPPQSA